MSSTQIPPTLFPNAAQFLLPSSHTHRRTLSLPSGVSKPLPPTPITAQTPLPILTSSTSTILFPVAAINTTTTHSMPIPGTSEAPKFDGHYLSDFIEDLELHFQRAGVTDEDRQVNFITRYSTDKIRKQIGFLPELDRSKKNKTWAAAKTVLTEFYGDVDKPRPLSLAEFQAWVQSSADKPAFVSKDQVNKYYAEFMSKGRPLLDNKQVSDNDLNSILSNITSSSRHTTLSETASISSSVSPS